MRSGQDYLCSDCVYCEELGFESESGEEYCYRRCIHSDKPYIGKAEYSCEVFRSKTAPPKVSYIVDEEQSEASFQESYEPAAEEMQPIQTDEQEYYYGLPDRETLNREPQGKPYSKPERGCSKVLLGFAAGVALFALVTATVISFTVEKITEAASEYAQTTEQTQVTVPGRVNSLIGLALREGPGHFYSRIATMRHKSTVDIYEIKDGWAYVECEDYAGWCQAAYLIYEDGILPEAE